jgi:hypothetical protein
MAEHPDDITMSKNALEMLIVANEYCLFMEEIEDKSKNDILEFVHRVLPLMYTKGSLLPEVIVENPEANMRFVTEEKWENLFTFLRDIFGEDDEFWIIDPQYINETEPLKASLSENLSDIYQDMKDFVLLYQKNTVAARQNALTECRKLFADHWGYRIGKILSQLHHLIYENDDDLLEDPLRLF